MQMSQRTITIYLKDISIYAHHGVFQQEKEVGNHFLLNISVSFNTAEQSLEDKIENTISYADLYQIACQEMGIVSDTLEDVAERIANQIIKTFPFVIDVNIDINKQAPPIPGINGAAGVKYTYHKNG